MNLEPLTVFKLAFLVGAMGGLWAALKPGRVRSYRDVFTNTLGSGCLGLCSALLGYEKLGQSEFGQCTVLGVALGLGMLGEKAFNHLLSMLQNYIGKLDVDHQRKNDSEDDTRDDPDE